MGASARWGRRAVAIKSRVKNKAKILLAFYQVVTQVGDTYLVTFPRSVETSLQFLSAVNFRLSGLGLPLACYGLGSFKAQLVFMMSAPVVCMLVAKMISWTRRDRSHEKMVRERRKQSGLADAAALPRAPDAASEEAGPANSVTAGEARTVLDFQLMQVALEASTYHVLPTLLHIAFLAFPAVSSLAFKAFRCDDLDANDDAPGPAVMSADFGVTCHDEYGVRTEEYLRIRSLAFVALILYPVLLPCAYATLLFRVRKAVWLEEPTRLSMSVDFLTAEYDRAYFFWELVEVMPAPH